MNSRVPVGSIAPTPNVTPMIDVMLVLLCIFMIVTPALTSGVIAEPPVGENLTPKPEDEFDRTLAIDATGRFYLERKLIAIADLGPALRALYPEGAIDRVLFVRAHRGLPFSTVSAAIDVARENGVVTLGMVSLSREP